MPPRLSCSLIAAAAAAAGGAGAGAGAARERRTLRVEMLLYTPTTDLTWSYAHNLGRVGAISRLHDAHPELRIVSDVHVIQERVKVGESCSQDSIRGVICTDILELNPEVRRLLDRLASAGDEGDAGARLIIGTSFWYQDPMIAAAEAHPGTGFVHMTGYKSGTDNFITVSARAYQASYLAGMVAGGTSSSKLIGYVGAVQISELHRGINAFTLGARRAAANATVLVAWTNAWSDPDRSEWAVRWLEGRGCDVIGGQTNDFPAFRFAIESGRLAVGFHTDLRLLLGDAVLCSVYFDWAPLYERLAERVLAASSKVNFSEFGSQMWEGMDVAVPRLSMVSQRAPLDVHRMVQEEELALRNGSDRVFCGPLVNSSGAEVVAAGECLTDDDLRSMEWAVAGVVNVGDAVLPSEACGNGTWYSFDPASGAFTCTTCAPGTHAVAGATSCDRCGDGTSSAAGSAECSPVPGGGLSVWLVAAIVSTVVVLGASFGFGVAWVIIRSHPGRVYRSVMASFALSLARVIQGLVDIMLDYLSLWQLLRMGSSLVPAYIAVVALATVASMAHVGINARHVWRLRHLHAASPRHQAWQEVLEAKACLCLVVCEDVPVAALSLAAMVTEDLGRSGGSVIILVCFTANVLAAGMHINEVMHLANLQQYAAAAGRVTPAQVPPVGPLSPGAAAGAGADPPLTTRSADPPLSSSALFAVLGGSSAVMCHSAIGKAPPSTSDSKAQPPERSGAYGNAALSSHAALSSAPSFHSPAEVRQQQQQLAIPADVAAAIAAATSS